MLEDLKKLSGPRLVRLINQLTEGKVKRLASKEAGLKRLMKLAKDPALYAKLDAMLAAEAANLVVFDDGTPLESLEQVLTEASEATPMKSPGKRPTAAEAGHVNVNGRHVRPENVERVQRGESLWGRVGSAPSKKDALPGGQNLNYPRKAKVREVAEGTKRHQLIQLMSRASGVTLEEVASRFELTQKAAIYMVRDLHYCVGHGIEVRKGRIHLRR